MTSSYRNLLLNKFQTRKDTKQEGPMKISAIKDTDAIACPVHRSVHLSHYSPVFSNSLSCVRRFLQFSLSRWWLSRLTYCLSLYALHLAVSLVTVLKSPVRGQATHPALRIDFRPITAPVEFVKRNMKKNYRHGPSHSKRIKGLRMLYGCKGRRMLHWKQITIRICPSPVVIQ
jgi:hypothetical protein